VGEVARALAGGVGSLDMGLLAEHAAAMGSRSLCSRLGHLLERLGAEAPALLPLASKGFVRLDPGRPWAAGWDRRWRVNVNLEDKDWLGPGVE
jgi:predicted transcriptional regulator of viral defense system